MKVTYTEEAIADIVEAITYLNERNPTAAGNLDTDIARCIERFPSRANRLTPRPGPLPVEGRGRIGSLIAQLCGSGN